ncbi:MAG: peptidase U32 family protein [Promethearchaeia archaeon]
MDKVELMAPLKNKKSLKAVIGKADAVYFGVESLNMRMFSDNIRLKVLPKLVKECHEHGLFAYLVTNTIIYDNEFGLLQRILDKAQEAEVDAVIVYDVGAIELARERGLTVHISTQANISNFRSARFYERLGAERLILARELSLQQIKAIKSKLMRSEVEIFVHGAQCTSVSGRCYFSAEICESQQYSANRGKCVQPCRRKWKVIDEDNNELLYDGVYFINAKDLCMIGHIPELVEAGIDAFKIEGRMRDPIYIDEVVSCYREALDAYYHGTYSDEKVQEWLGRLRKVYNRGFSTGFYFEMPKGAEISHTIGGNLSTHKKVEIGKVLSYYSKIKAAKILLTRGQIKLHDELFIIGNNSSTYVRQKVGSLQIKRKKNLTETPYVHSSDERIAVGILVDQPVKANDRVYKLRKRP